LESLTIDTTTVTPGSVFIYSGEGKFQLSDTSEESVFSGNTPQLIEFNYWWGVYPMPEEAKRYCLVLAAMRTLSTQVAGTHDIPSTYSLPEGSVTIGQAYVNIREAYNTLKEERAELEKRLIKYPRTL